MSETILTQQTGTCKLTHDFPCLLENPSAKCCRYCLTERKLKLTAVLDELGDFMKMLAGRQGVKV